jgi:hypothetical protein
VPRVAEYCGGTYPPTRVTLVPNGMCQPLVLPRSCKTRSATAWMIVRSSSEHRCRSDLCTSKASCTKVPASNPRSPSALSILAIIADSTTWIVLDSAVSCDSPLRVTPRVRISRASEISRKINQTSRGWACDIWPCTSPLGDRPPKDHTQQQRLRLGRGNSQPISNITPQGILILRVTSQRLPLPWSVGHEVG